MLVQSKEDGKSSSAKGKGKIFSPSDSHPLPLPLPPPPLILTPHHSSPPSLPTDKLLQTKLREREIKDAYKEETRRQLEARKGARQEEMALVKAERLEHDTKRASRDRRLATKKANHAETGQMCEHGVWRCRICFPHKSTH